MLLTGLFVYLADLSQKLPQNPNKTGGKVGLI